jgi:8-oxo-dGTP pyrophosphatase MutT (NUDIX family)
MFFKQKIYFNNKPLILTNDAQAYLYDHPLAEAYPVYTGAFPRNFRLAIAHLKELKSLGAIIEDISVSSLQAELHKLFTPICAAGGVVRNENGSILMIYRRGKWDLPKGKCDAGESIEVCAVREVQEETGLQQILLGEKICDTWHVYQQHHQSLLKCTTWYEMQGSEGEILVPQKEENILEAKWIPEKELGHAVFNSYEAIREVLTTAGMKW